MRRKDAALRQTFEPFKRVIYEDPVFVAGGSWVLAVLGHRRRRYRIAKKKKMDKIVSEQHSISAVTNQSIPSITVTQRNT